MRSLPPPPKLKRLHKPKGMTYAHYAALTKARRCYVQLAATVTAWDVKEAEVLLQRAERALQGAFGDEWSAIQERLMGTVVRMEPVVESCATEVNQLAS